MGHDITAVREGASEPLAYFRRSMFAEDTHILYEALDAADCWGEVSGNGGTRYYTRRQIEQAIARLPTGVVGVDSTPPLVGGPGADQTSPRMMEVLREVRAALARDPCYCGTSRGFLERCLTAPEGVLITFG